MLHYETVETKNIWNRIFEYKHEKDVMMMSGLVMALFFTSALFLSIVFR